ncbi:MAG TPA: SdpI family protein [Anaerolineales bacterium]|nr:SdpI family protein [Anaerolineales bacterium]
MLSLLFFLFLIVFGIVSILIALPLLDGKVKPNLIYGFRVRATLESPKTWYAVNKYFAQRLLLAAVAEIVAAIALFTVPNMEPSIYVLSTLIVFVIAFSIGMMQTSSYLKSLPRKNEDNAGKPALRIK